MPFGFIKVISSTEDLVEAHLVGNWSALALNDLPSDRDVHLILNTAYGWSGTDLSFLAEIKRLKKVEIIGHKPIAAIDLPLSIESIAIRADLGCMIDFTRYPHLKSVQVDFSRYSETVLNVFSLTKLYLGKLKSKDLACLSNIKNLESLTLTTSSMNSLDGIGILENLKFLEILYCYKLTNIGDLTRCVALQDVSIQNCKKIESFSALGGLPELRFLCLENTGKIDSLDIFLNTPVLQKLDVCRTNVIDGDFGRLLSSQSLKSMHFEKRKHYSHTSDSWHKAKYPDAVWTQGF